VDGTIGGEPDACIAVECAPGEFAACRGDYALTCNNAGTNYDVLACEYGCSEAAGGCNSCSGIECEKHIIPKYLPTICNQLGNGADLDLQAPATIDTSGDLNCTSVVAQQDGPEICVVRYRTIHVAQNQTLRIIGTRVVALVADREVTIEGTIDAAAYGDMNGPGGGFLTSGSASTSVGGGGAGFRTAGGAGGDGTTAGGAANGGAASVHAGLSTLLLGGTRPAPASAVTKTAAPPPGAILGGGGGGLTLVSCRASVSVSGLLDVSGGGGGGAKFGGAGGHPTGGGGSGGTIVIQGLQVSVTGQLLANGGAGGGNASLDSLFGNPGENAARLFRRAHGGAGASAGGEGDGGDGGTTMSPLPGAKLNGGGGGSGGFILTYTPVDVQPTLMPVAASPIVEPSATLATN
jgi:hypothetical protein